MIGAFVKRKINSIHSSDALTRNVRPMGGHVEYNADGTDKQTDGRQTVTTYITLSARRGLRNNHCRTTCRSRKPSQEVAPTPLLTF